MGWPDGGRNFIPTVSVCSFCCVFSQLFIREYSVLNVVRLLLESVTNVGKNLYV